GRASACVLGPAQSDDREVEEHPAKHLALEHLQDVRLLNIRAGFPATIVSAGTSLVTTLPAPTIAFSPTVIPHNNVALEPMDAPRFTRVGSHVQSAFFCNLPSAVVARGNLSLMKVTLCPIKTSSSMVTPSQIKV